MQRKHFELGSRVKIPGWPCKYPNDTGLPPASNPTRLQPDGSRLHMKNHHGDAMRATRGIPMRVWILLEAPSHEKTVSSRIQAVSGLAPPVFTLANDFFDSSKHTTDLRKGLFWLAMRVKRRTGEAPV